MDLRECKYGEGGFKIANALMKGVRAIIESLRSNPDEDEYDLDSLLNAQVRRFIRKHVGCDVNVIYTLLGRQRTLSFALCSVEVDQVCLVPPSLFVFDSHLCHPKELWGGGACFAAEWVVH